MAKKYVNDFIQVLESKKGGLYLSVTKDSDVFQEFLANVKPGDAIFLNNKAEERARQVDEGKITQDRADELEEKIGFIKYSTTFSYGG